MNGPFLHAESSKIITSFLTKELFPQLKKMRKLAIEIAEMKRGLWQSLWRSELNKKLETYRRYNKDFLQLQNKWNDLDILYKDIPVNIKDNAPEMAILVQDYYNMSAATNQHFNEGLQLLNQIDKMLTNQNTASYTRISLILSTVAIISSIVAIWATVTNA